MEHQDQLSDYFREKDRKKMLSSWTKNIGTLPEMTEEEIRQSCAENNGYETPELNDKLYLHFRGFKKIENLDKYTACKAIWLDSNGFEKIENLGQMVELRCLYLSKNLIPRIEGLECLKNLVTLDLSNNRISRIEGLTCCPLLQSLNISRNALSSAESIEEVKNCLSLLNLDLTNNHLPQDESIIQCLAQSLSINNLSINGNEVTRMPSFRKKMIVAMPHLGYLDRPVEEIERIGAVAYMEGGAEAEQKAREAYREAKNQQRQNELAEFRAWQQQQQEDRKARALEKQQSKDDSDDNEIDEQTENSQQKSGMLSEMTAEEIEQRDRETQKAQEDERIALGNEKSVKTVIQNEAPKIVNSNENDIETTEIAEKEAVSIEEVSFRIEDLSLEQVCDDSEHLNEQIEQIEQIENIEIPIRELYWTETMDMELANHVKKHLLDFDLVSSELMSLAESGRFGTQLTRNALFSMLSSENCKLRWKQLDAHNWAQLPPETDALQTIFKVCVTPQVLGAGHGAQPSFQALSSIASSSFPTYLKPPKNLPSVNDNDSDDSDSDQDEENDANNGRKPIKIVLSGLKTAKHEMIIEDLNELE